MFSVEMCGDVRTRLFQGQPQLRRDGTLRSAASSYRVTDPQVLAGRLAGAGFEIVELRPVSMKVRPENLGRTQILVARYPGSTGEAGYHDHVKFLLDHTGREAFKVAAGTCRAACANQFYAAPLSIRHTDPEIDVYLERPWVAAEMVRQDGTVVHARLEGQARELAGGHLFTFLKEQHPRLYRTAIKALPLYQAVNDRTTAWAVLQAFTHVKRASLGRLASLALTEGWEELKAGIVPACWN
jgi:hypothetical protein